MNKRGYVILAFSLALASAAYYFYRRNLSFNPTKESAAAEVEVVFNP
jgi:hypothetical protein